MILSLKPIFYLSLLLCFTFVNASILVNQRTLEDSMIESYKTTSPNVDSISQMFTKGNFYGRLRFNSFGFVWHEELEFNGKEVRKDHGIVGLGGSFLYKSAYLHGFAFTVGLYATESYGSLNQNEAYLYKAGKGVLSREDMLNDGTSNILSMSQAYLEYKHENTSLKVGRQIFESFLTKSNDTKMIPNTFEGVTLNSKILENTEIKMAYLTKQKLRDHSEFHHLFSKDGYSENDDAMMHLGITRTTLKEKKIEDRLLIFDMVNKSIENYKIHINYTAIPELLSSAMLQVDYTMNVDGFMVIPAFRYMQQFDHGVGPIGGANIKTITQGYSNPKTLDSWLFGARVDVKADAWKLRFGYTKVADEGDIIAPWRGFPTGGFTRVMGQYNWYANTETYMIRADYNFAKVKWASNLKAFMRYAIQDFDDSKPGVPYADSQVVTLDIIKRFETIPNLYMKVRMGHVFGEAQTTNVQKADPSYSEARFEINYLF